MKIRYFLLLISYFFVFQLKTQINDFNIKNDNISTPIQNLNRYDSLIKEINRRKIIKIRNPQNRLLVLPAVAFSQETNLVFGFAGIKTFVASKKDLQSRTSNISLLGLYSLNKNYFIYLKGTQYYNKERIIFNHDFSFSTIYTKFWGLGNRTNNLIYDRLSFELASFEGNLLFKTIKKYYIGFNFDLQKEFKYKYNDSGLFFKSFPTLINNKGQKIFGLGPVLAFDTRNDANYPSKGSFIKLSNLIYSTFWGSDVNILNFECDIRKFISFKKQRIIALQLNLKLNFGETLSYRRYARLGGIMNGRGYFDGRFTDNHFVNIQGEYRTNLKIIKINKDWPKIVVFGSVGDVFKYLSDLKFKLLKTAFGIGLRVPLLKYQTLYLRIDLGFNNWDKTLSPPIVNFAEAF